MQTDRPAFSVHGLNGSFDLWLLHVISWIDQPLLKIPLALTEPTLTSNEAYLADQIHQRGHELLQALVDYCCLATASADPRP